MTFLVQPVALSATLLLASTLLPVTVALPPANVRVMAVEQLSWLGMVASSTSREKVPDAAMEVLSMAMT